MNTAIVCPLSSLELWTRNEDGTGACGSSKTKYRDTGKSKPFRRDWPALISIWIFARNGPAGYPTVNQTTQGKANDHRTEQRQFALSTMLFIIISYLIGFIKCITVCHWNDDYYTIITWKHIFHDYLQVSMLCWIGHVSIILLQLINGIWTVLCRSYPPGWATLPE